MKLADFSVLTLDCYGTLIDWKGGITTALQPLLNQAGVMLGRGEVLETFARHESAQQAETPGLVYSALLARVHRRLAAEFGATPDAAADQRFGASVPDWPAFADSAASLRYLKEHYRLVILSAWIDRRHRDGGWGATMPAPGTSYDFRFTSMADLVRAHQEDLRA